jgi:hypothetical protein
MRTARSTQIIKYLPHNPFGRQAESKERLKLSANLAKNLLRLANVGVAYKEDLDLV